MQRATGISTLKTALRESYAGMATGITRPKSVEWRLEDANRGRPCNPLGAFPDVAEACIDNNGAFHFVAGPVMVMLSHIKRRYRGKMSTDMRQALITAKRESDEAESVSLSIACSLANLQESELIAEEKEAVEAALAWEHVAEITADKLAAIQEAR